MVAVLFMFTSITLAIYSDQQAAGGGKIEDELLESGLDEIDWGIPAEPAAEEAPAAPDIPNIVEEAAEEVLNASDEPPAPASEGAE